VDDIPAEFYKHAPIYIYSWLASFFNSMISHGYLPPVMSDVLLIPVPKNKFGDVNSSSNYRPVAIATAVSKIVEKLLLSRFCDLIESSDFQFGFKKYHSTDLCIFALKEVVNYYRTLNTPTFICFIDIKSAFDRVSYSKLFRGLLRRGVNSLLVRFLMNWYVNQRLFIRWGNTTSVEFFMSNSIRQGSILSPYLFNVYVDDLNLLLSNAGVGCRIAGRTMNNFSYADDLALLAPTASSLNVLLSLCDEFADKNYIKFNTTKSVCMCVLPQQSAIGKLPNIYLSGNVLAYVSSFKYLGHIICSDFTDDEDIRREIRGFCMRGNLLVRKYKFCSVKVRCFLFKTFCYSVYGATLWSRCKTVTMAKLKVCYNKIFRMLLGYPPWHSARSLFVNHSVRSFEELQRYNCYNIKMRVYNSNNVLLRTLVSSDAVVILNITDRWNSLLSINLR